MSSRSPDQAAPAATSSFVVLIPARLASTRLPDKPLADIAGIPMVVRVANQARRSQAIRVAIATDSPQIADVARAHGHEAIMTRADHASGTERLAEAITLMDNGLKQEIYLKQIATQFGLTERNLFDELQVQKQILKGQPQPKPKLEIVPKTEEKPFADSDKTAGLLVLEEKLVELMLKYGDRILTRRDSENNSYQTTVIEEIIHHFQEDDCEILTETNRKIIDEVQQGLEQNEIRSGNFFFGLMDEDISGKIADALVENYETSDWRKFNIYFRTEDEVLDKVVRDVILRHKREYVLKLIEDLKKSLDETEEKAEIYEQIVRLNQLNSKIDQKLFRIL